MALVIVDSDILIDFARGDQKAASSLIAFRKRYVVAISSITEMELIVGCRNKSELSSLHKFLKTFQVLPVTEDISKQASDLLVRYNLSHGLLIPDAIIAATAIFHDEEFITNNQRDYRFIAGLRLLPY